MFSVSVRAAARYFAAIPETHVFSDLMTSGGIRLVALVLAGRRDHSDYGGGIRWPAFTVPEISKAARMSERSVKREAAHLRQAGFLTTVKTKQGNRYEVTAPDFAGDTFRGKPHVSRKAKTLTSMSVIGAPISDGAFHLLLMLEATGKQHQAVKVPQSKLVGYFPSTSKGRDHITARHLNNWLRELEAVGLLTRNRQGVKGVNEYVLHREDLVINGAKAVDMNAVPILAAPGTEHTEDEETQDHVNAPRGVLDFSGLSLAKAFQRRVKEYRRDPRWSRALSRPGAIDLPALAGTFDRWMADGTDYSTIAAMIDMYPSVSDLRCDPAYLPASVRAYVADALIWRDFLALRTRLYDRVMDSRPQHHWAA